MESISGTRNAVRPPSAPPVGARSESARSGSGRGAEGAGQGGRVALFRADTFQPAPANRAPAPSRPVASRPTPAELTNEAYGQQGQSPNQTGRIDGAAELAQFVNAGYNGGRFGPVSITPATLREGNSSRPVHLVGISGTEPVKGQSTGWATNFKAGFELDNPGLRNARDAILRTVPAGSDLVLSGHSQGGMIAQQLAADPQIKERYNVLSTVTFGSPMIGLGRREGEVHRIAAGGDPVPRLSAASQLPVTSTISLLGQQNIRTDFPINPLNPLSYGNGITAHSRDYTSEANPDLARMDALGRKNPREPATLEFNPADRQFFSSPANTSAPR